MLSKLSVFILLTTAAAAAKEPVAVWKGGKGYGVKTEHLAMPLTEETHYSDRYTLEAWLDDGTRMYVSVLAKNFPKSNVTIKSRFTDKAGKNHRTTKKIKQGALKTSTSPFLVEGAGHNEGFCWKARF